MDNKALRQNVTDELDFEPCVDATHIGVAADDGVVTLSGHVKNFAEKLMAEQAAKRVKGVRAVVDELQINAHPHIPDEEIASRAVQIFRWSSDFSGLPIQVQVEKGWVTLSGEVEWQEQRKKAEDVVRHLQGVTGIVDNLTLKHSLPSDDIKKKIDAALDRSLLVNGSDIRVSAKEGGKVVVEGRVKNWAEHDAVEKIAWSVPGVKTLDDRLLFA